MNHFRWAIWGTGNMGEKFASTVEKLKDCSISTVISRSKKQAEEFGKKWNIPNCYDEKEFTQISPQVDGIYIATPVTSHFSNVSVALEKHIPVLCEKPLGASLKEAEKMIASSKAKKVFLAEAIMTGYYPAMVDTFRAIERGDIGKPQTLIADFCMKASPKSKPRLFSQELGGGALYELGTYPVYLAHALFGVPSKIRAVASYGDENVDIKTSAVLQFKNGETAIFSVALDGFSTKDAIIGGALGCLTVHCPWWRPNEVSSSKNGETPSKKRYCDEVPGLEFEITSVMEAIRSGKIESDIVPHSLSKDIASTFDQIFTESKSAGSN